MQASQAKRFLEVFGCETALLTEAPVMTHNGASIGEPVNTNRL